MLQIDDTIISRDVLGKKFACDLGKCKGACCVHGDSGAPLEDNETEILKDIFQTIRPFMRAEGIEAVEKQGMYIIDSDGDKVTPLVNGMECAYAIFENGIAQCAIEKAFLSNAIKFQKPISCHLYPVRVKKYQGFTAVNYHEWEICKPALSEGKRSGVHLSSFLKTPLVRKFGNAWYKKLQIANDHWMKNKL